MKKSFKILAFFLLTCLFINKVDAKCNDEKIIIDANQIYIGFNGVIGIEENENDSVVLSIDNIPSGYFIIVTNTTINKKETFKNIKDNYIYVKTPNPSQLYNYVVRIYSSEPVCENELIREVKLSSLVFNRWYLSEQCEEINNLKMTQDNDFEMCNAFTKKIYSANEFIAGYELIINKSNEPKDIDKVLNRVFKYYYFALIPIILLSVYYTIKIIIIKKRKKAQYE